MFEVLIFYELYLSCVGSMKVQLIETGSFCLETHKQIYEKKISHLADVILLGGSSVP